MLKLSNSQRKWLVLAVVAWLIILAGLIFIPMTRPADSREAQVAPTNSLATTMQSVNRTGGASVAQLVSPARVYDAEQFAGYTTLCPGEPEQLKQAKLEAFELTDNAPELDGAYGYMVLLPQDQTAPVVLDQVALKDIDICTLPQSDSYQLDYALPFFYTDGHWALGINQ